MQLCNAEIMKRIKQLNEEKEECLSYEQVHGSLSYREGETPTANPYSYEETRAKVDEIDREVMHLRFLLAQANCHVVLDGFGITIAEGLVKLAQLQNKASQLESLGDRPQISRRLTSNGILEFTECRYDTAVVREEARAVRQEISALQIAIDRANLIHMVEL